MKANWRSSLDTLEVLNIVSRWFNNWQPMISFLLLTLQVCIKWRSLGPNRWGLERSYSYMLLRSPHHAWSHFEGGGFDPPQGILDHVSGGMSDEKKNAGLMVKLGMFSAWDVLYFQYSQVTFVPVWRWFWLPGILGSAPTSPLSYAKTARWSWHRSKCRCNLKRCRKRFILRAPWPKSSHPAF